jgi:hypothetical protein
MSSSLENCQKTSLLPSFPRGIIWAACAIPLICVFASSANSRNEMRVVARLSHDFNGKFELFSYEAVPNDADGEAETRAKRQYGQLLSHVKSPLTIFTCVWRNPEHRKSDKDKPRIIFMSCNTAASAVKTPKSLVESAELYNKTDRSNLKAEWQLENGSYRLSCFEIEILAKGKSYRSQNLSTDMPQIRVDQGKMIFPRSLEDNFVFELQSKLPFRQNSGKEQGKPIVSISIAGTAEPIPKWMNY